MLSFKDRKGDAWAAAKSLFQQEVLKRGILFSSGNNINYSHTDADVEKTLLVYRDALKILKDAVDRGKVDALLEGPPVEPVFKLRNA